MNKNKLWSLCLLVLVLVMLILFAIPTAIIDPFFHYHTPLDGLQYPIDNQRYQNDGIVKRFSYDALITGTSITENFKTSEFDALFGVHSIKVPFAGATLKELNGNLERAIAANPDLKMVLFAMDDWFLIENVELMRMNGDFPTYLYDSNPFNDVQYLLSKEIFFDNTLRVLEYTKSGQTTPDFDTYSNWHDRYTYDAQNVIWNAYARDPKVDEIQVFTKEQARIITDSLVGSTLRIARENPDIQFIYFFPPYSILWWDYHSQHGSIEQHVQSFELATKLLLEADNIQLYSFFTDYNLITNLNNYKDILHYSQDINSLILQRIHDGENQLTKENYVEYWQEVLEYYQSYDYEAFFVKKPDSTEEN